MSGVPPRDLAPGQMLVAEAEITLRDQFAMAAVTGQVPLIGEHNSWRWDSVARNAYALADEMLKAREEVGRG